MGFQRDFKRFVYSSSQFVITRFPFWEAFSTAMLLGEWDGKNRSHGIPDIVIYAHIGISVVLASIMSFDEHKRRQSALLSAAQMAVVTLASLVLWKGSGDMVRLKIFSRNLAVVAAYLQLSSGIVDTKASHKSYGQLGNLLMSACLLIEAYLIYSWSSEKERLYDILPSQLSSYREPLTFVFCLMFALSALCFITGSNVQAGSKLALALWILVVMISINQNFWSGHMEVWMHYRILASDICFGLVLAVHYSLRD